VIVIHNTMFFESVSARELTLKEILEQNEREERAAFDFSRITHPVLKTHPKESLSETQITLIMIKQLAMYRRENNYGPYLWEKWYSQAEKQVATKFCKLTPGKSKEEIIQLAERPRYTASSFSCWPESKNYSASWIYEFGPQKHAVLLSFVNDRCVKAESRSLDQMCKLADCLYREIKLSAKGLTQLEIGKKLGTENLSSSVLFVPIKTSDLPHIKSLYFTLPVSNYIQFNFSNGHCSEINLGILAH